MKKKMKTFVKEEPMCTVKSQKSFSLLHCACRDVCTDLESLLYKVTQCRRHGLFHYFCMAARLFTLLTCFDLFLNEVMAYYFVSKKTWTRGHSSQHNFEHWCHPFGLRSFEKLGAILSSSTKNWAPKFGLLSGYFTFGLLRWKFALLAKGNTHRCGVFGPGESFEFSTLPLFTTLSAPLPYTVILFSLFSRGTAMDFNFMGTFYWLWRQGRQGLVNQRTVRE